LPWGAKGRTYPTTWTELQNQIYWGNEGFVHEMQGKIAPKTNLSEIPSAQRRHMAKFLESYEETYRDRDTAICNAYESGA